MKPFLKSVITLVRPQAATSKQSDSRRTILIIDDDQSFLLIVGELLEGLGYRVFSALSGADGLEILRGQKLKFHLVILDYSMPGLDGAQTLEQIRKLHPHLKVIGMTGFAAFDLPDCFRNGVDRLLAKPFRTSELSEIIPALLANGAPSQPPMEVVVQTTDVRHSQQMPQGRLQLTKAEAIEVSLQTDRLHPRTA